MNYLSKTIILGSFLLNVLCPLPAGADELLLPKPGNMVHLSPSFDPAVLKGIKVDTLDPFRFDFVLDRGKGMNGMREESTKLVKYFMAALTTPDKDIWVNLSPYEKDRIVPDSFGKTEMGRDLLAQDYILKQITASLIYPEDALGKKFWKKIYEEAARKFGTTYIPINTFNKVWIVPDRAIIYENMNAGTAFIRSATLKVMLESDYLSAEKNQLQTNDIGQQVVRASEASLLSNKVLRDIVIPKLTQEVNEGSNFAQLRQAYNALILAKWYKMKVKNSILSQVYKDKNKISGAGYVNAMDPKMIYERYVEAFKKGAFNYIKDEHDPVTKQMIPRKYFSGGVVMGDLAMTYAKDAGYLSGAFFLLPIRLDPINADNNSVLGLTDEAMRAENGVDAEGPKAPQRQVSAREFENLFSKYSTLMNRWAHDIAREWGIGHNQAEDYSLAKFQSLSETLSEYPETSQGFMPKLRARLKLRMLDQLRVEKPHSRELVEEHNQIEGVKRVLYGQDENYPTVADITRVSGISPDEQAERRLRSQISYWSTRTIPLKDDKLPPEYITDGGMDELERRIDITRMLAALDTMPNARYRFILEEHFLKGITQKAIGEELGITEGGVGHLIVAASKSLRVQMIASVIEKFFEWKRSGKRIAGLSEREEGLLTETMLKAIEAMPDEKHRYTLKQYYFGSILRSHFDAVPNGRVILKRLMEAGILKYFSGTQVRLAGNLDQFRPLIHILADTAADQVLDILQKFHTQGMPLEEITHDLDIRGDAINAVLKRAKAALMQQVRYKVTGIENDADDAMLTNAKLKVKDDKVPQREVSAQELETVTKQYLSRMKEWVHDYIRSLGLKNLKGQEFTTTAFLSIQATLSHFPESNPYFVAYLRGTLKNLMIEQMREDNPGSRAIIQQHNNIEAAKNLLPHGATKEDVRKVSGVSIEEQQVHLHQLDDVSRQLDGVS